MSGRGQQEDAVEEYVQPDATDKRDSTNNLDLGSYVPMHKNIL